MRKHVMKAIIQFIVILMLTAGMALGWAGYVYEGMPLVSAICLTILDGLLLLLHAIEYVIAMIYFMERQNEKENSKSEVEE